MRTLRACLLSSVIALSTGCAFVDQKLALKYTAPASVSVPAGVSNTVVMAKVDLDVSLQKKGDAYIIGTVKNGYGIKTADAVTSDRIEEWILGALTQELRIKGFAVRRAETFPPPVGVDRGAHLVIRRLWVEQDQGFWTVGAITELSLPVDLYSRGGLVKKVLLEGKGDSRSIVGLSEQKEESLEKALRA